MDEQCCKNGGPFIGNLSSWCPRVWRCLPAANNRNIFLNVFLLNVYIAGVAPASFLFNLCNMGVCYSYISRRELFARIPGAAYDLICDLCNT